MSRLFPGSRALVALVGAVLSTSPLLAQPVVTGVTSYSTTADGTPGGWRTNTRGGDFYSNTYITQGANPSTDAFLFNGNATGSLLGSGLSLGVGSHTFYLWGFTGYQPNHGVSLMFDGALGPQLGAWYNTTSSTNAAPFGLDDFGNSAAAAGLSSVFGDYTVSITNFSFAQVSRNVSIGSYQWAEGPQLLHNVGRLELLVTDNNAPPTTTVPEPGTFVLLAAGLAGLVIRRRRAA